MNGSNLSKNVQKIRSSTSDCKAESLLDNFSRLAISLCPWSFLPHPAQSLVSVVMFFGHSYIYISIYFLFDCTTSYLQHVRALILACEI